MARKPAWISTVKSEIGKSPVALNVFFGFILVCLEELVEVEFACPCNPTWNALFAATFFIVPAILIFLLMLYIRGCGRKCSKERWKNVGISGVPAMLWLILMFLDGQYFACAMTSWSGIFVSFNGSSHQKWCKPANQNSSEELIIKTQGFFALSQVIGTGLVMLFILILVYAIYQKCKKSRSRKDSSTHQDFGASVPTNIQDLGDSGDVQLSCI